MNKIATNIIFPIFNQLYNKFPKVYIPLYFAYKYIHNIKMTSFIKRWVVDGDVVVDLGANIGSESLILSRLVGKDGEVHSFEPDPINFKILKKISKNFKNVYLNQKAIGNKNGYIKLYVSSSLNTDHQTFNIGESRKWLKVPLISLDKYFSQGENVKLVKIDIQGYDYFALEGMKKTLSRSKKVALVGELWPYAIKRSGINPVDYIKLIRKLGFKFIEPKKMLISEISKEVDNPYYSLDFIATKP